MLHRLLPCALALLATTASAQSTANPLPAAEKFAGLYINAFVNFDSSALKQVNELLRPLYDGQDAYDMKRFDSAERAYAEKIASRLKTEAQSNDPALHEAIEHFAESSLRALKRSPCSVTGSAITPNPDTDIMSVEVKYQCLLPDVAPGLTTASLTYGKHDPRKSGRSADYYRQLSGLYETAPVTHRLCSSATMVKMPDSELWQTGDPDGITRAAVSALLHWHKALSALRPGKWKPCQPAG